MSELTNQEKIEILKIAREIHLGIDNSSEKPVNEIYTELRDLVGQTQDRAGSTDWS